MDCFALIERAANWQKQADDKLRPRETNTPKKLAQARSAEMDGVRLKRAASYLVAYAKALGSGAMPPELAGLKPTKDRLLEIAATETEHVSNGYHGYLVEKLGQWRDNSPEAVALRALADGNGHVEDSKVIELRRMEDSLRFLDIPGFFPTPKPVIERMLELAEIAEGMTVLEPSAGKGDIADAIERQWGHVHVALTCCEINPRLREILKAKGHDLLTFTDDFLKTHNASYPVQWRGYDRIIMNPPFERGQDVQHVKHAYECLADDGRLVAVMASGASFDKFHPWLDSHGGWSEPLDPKAFSDKDAFRKTGVNCRLVVIDK